MNTSSMPRTIRLQRSWTARLGDALAGLAAQATATFSAWRARWRERRAMQDAMELDEATLRDLGMPLWMQEEARARREQRDLRRDIERLQARVSRERYY
jgi:hypothetical protein